MANFESVSPLGASNVAAEVDNATKPTEASKARNSARAAGGPLGDLEAGKRTSKPALTKRAYNHMPYWVRAVTDGIVGTSSRNPVTWAITTAFGSKTIAKSSGSRPTTNSRPVDKLSLDVEENRVQIPERRSARILLALERLRDADSLEKEWLNFTPRGAYAKRKPGAISFKNFFRAAGIKLFDRPNAADVLKISRTDPPASAATDTDAQKQWLPELVSYQQAHERHEAAKYAACGMSAASLETQQLVDAMLESRPEQQRAFRAFVKRAHVLAVKWNESVNPGTTLPDWAMEAGLEPIDRTSSKLSRQEAPPGAAGKAYQDHINGMNAALAGVDSDTLYLIRRAVRARTEAVKRLGHTEALLTRAAEKRLAQQDGRMKELVGNPGDEFGIGEGVEKLKAELGDLHARFKATEPQRRVELLAPMDESVARTFGADAVMEQTLIAAQIAFAVAPPVDGAADAAPRLLADPAKTAQALASLKTMTPLDVADLFVNGKEDDPARKLVTQLGSLSHGPQMVGSLIGQPMVVPNADGLDKYELQRRADLLNVSMRVIFLAGLAKQEQGLPLEMRRHLESAIAAAQAIVREGSGDIDQILSNKVVSSDQLQAFNLVRMRYFSKEKDSDYQYANSFLKLVPVWLQSPALTRTGYAKKAWGNFYPMGEPTVFNPSTIETAAKCALSAGIVMSPNEAVEELRKKIVDMRNSDKFKDAKPPAAGQETDDRETATKIETNAAVAASAFGRAILDAINKDIPAHQMTKEDVAVPHQFGLDDNEFNSVPGLAAFWQRYSDPQDKMSPLQALRELADTVEPHVHDRAAIDLRRAADLVNVSYWFADPRIRDKETLRLFIEACYTKFKLRERLRITYSAIRGADITTLNGAYEGKPIRAGYRHTHSSDLFLELGVATPAYYFTLSKQETKTVRVNGGSGYSWTLPDHTYFGGRVDLDGRITYMNEEQEGVYVRQPRNKDTEERDRSRIVEMMTDLLAPDKVSTHDGAAVAEPLDALAMRTEATVAVLGDYYRRTWRGDVTVTGGPQLSNGIASGRIAGGGGLRGELKDTVAKERTGAFNYEEDKLQIVQSKNTVFGLNTRLGIPIGKEDDDPKDQDSHEPGHDQTPAPADQGQNTSSNRHLFKGKGSIGTTIFGVQKTTEIGVRGSETTLRLVTNNDETLPLQSRYIVDSIDLKGFEEATKQIEFSWSNHGMTYMKFPKDANKREIFKAFDKYVFARRDWKQFVGVAREKSKEEGGRFHQYLAVMAMQLFTAAPLDEMRNSAELRKRQADLYRKQGDPGLAAAYDALAARYEAIVKYIKAHPTSWQARRAALNERSQEVDTGGLAFVAKGVQRLAEGSHNGALYPRNR
ncbi:MAG: hypothetical protein ABW032_02570 [Burkholderiaceae bacterium]